MSGSPDSSSNNEWLCPIDSWGSDPSDRWVMVYADICCDGVWHRGHVSDVADSLPSLSPELVARLRAWTEWHDTLSDGNDDFPRTFYWEQRTDAPLVAFNEEGRAIARALKAELPPDWTVVYQDVDAWLRPDGSPIEARQLLLPGRS